MNTKNKYSILCFFGVTMLFGCKGVEENSTEQKPNILFILADDLGYHDLSCMGSKYYETPNIDRIANEGMVFTDGYAACQVCSPSRVSIMSGKFPARHGITDWIGARTGEEWRNAGRFNKLLPPEYIRSLPSEYTEALLEDIFLHGKTLISKIPMMEKVYQCGLLMKPLIL